MENTQEQLQDRNAVSRNKSEECSSRQKISTNELKCGQVKDSKGDIPKGNHTLDGIHLVQDKPCDIKPDKSIRGQDSSEKLMGDDMTDNSGIYRDINKNSPKASNNEATDKKTDLRHRELVMTVCKKEQETFIRLERINSRKIDYSRACHIGKGAFHGVIINNSVKCLEPLPKEDALYSFTACMTDRMQPNGNETRERRDFKFWFRGASKVDDNVYNNAYLYFKEIITPEFFPKDYISFIKKVISLAQDFQNVKCIEVSLTPDLEDPVENDLEWEECVLEEKDEDLEDYFELPVIGRREDSMEDITEYEEDEMEEEEEEIPMENVITVLTPAMYAYQYMPEVPVSNKTFLKFRVKTKADAFLALSAVYGDTELQTYEIQLGGASNKHTYVKDGGEGKTVKMAKTLNVLHGNEFDDFWLSWENHTIVIGKGKEKGVDTLLTFEAPPTMHYSVNCLAVSTGPTCDGEWEFIEYIYQSSTRKGRALAQKEAAIGSILWLAKKQLMLNNLDDAFPKSIETGDLLRRCKIKMQKMMSAVVALRDMQSRGLITEVARGIWMRKPVAKMDINHEVHLVPVLPALDSSNKPTILILTSLYCEKIAMDAILETKTSYVCQNGKGGTFGYSAYYNSSVYTFGCLGDHRVLHIKLPKWSRDITKSADVEEEIRSLLATFDRINHVFFVGCGGAVPDYMTYKKHVRLGDVVVSCPRSPKQTLYYQCDKVKQRERGDYEFSTKGYENLEKELDTCTTRLREKYARDSRLPRILENYIDKGVELLQSEVSNYSRPQQRSDKLTYMLDDGTSILAEHPQPSYTERKLNRENVPRLHFGPIGSNRFIATNPRLRLEFANRTGILAYDNEFQTLIKSVQKKQDLGFVIVRGMSDYVDGCSRKSWQPYAALAAAALTKFIIESLPRQ